MTQCGVFLQDFDHRPCVLDDGHDGPHMAWAPFSTDRIRSSSGHVSLDPQLYDPDED